MPIPSPPPSQFPFSGTPGCDFQISDDNIEADFKLFFNLELLDLVVTETDRYAVQQSSKSSDDWLPVTVHEIQIFLD